MSRASTLKRIKEYLKRYREDYPLDKTFEGLDEIDDLPPLILYLLFTSVISKDVARIRHISNTENSA